MSDWGIYSALSGVDNWEQKRQDKMANLMMAGKMEERANKDLQAQMEFEEGINERLDLVSQFDVLPEDQERINEEERKARINIIKGISKFNGDLKAYMSSGGISDIGEYKRNIINSSAVKNAAYNKAQYAQYVDAKSKGMFVGSSEVEVPVYDKEGQPKLDDKGNILREKKVLSMDKQMALFKKGLIDKIAVGNIEKKAALDPNMFAKKYKDPLKPWSKDNIVTEKNVYSELITMGYSEEQAKAVANRYGKEHAGNPETALKYNAMNPYQLKELKSKISYYKSKSSKGKSKSRSGEQRVLNTLAEDFQQLKPGEMSSKGVRGTAKPLSNTEREYFIDQFRNGDLKAFDLTYDEFDKDTQNAGYGLYNIARADELKALEKVKIKNSRTGKIEPMIKVQFSYDVDRIEDDDELKKIYELADNYGDARHNLRIQEMSIEDPEDKGFYTTKDVVTGYGYVPINNMVSDPTFRANFARTLNLRSNLDNAPQSSTDASMNQRYSNAVMEMASMIMSEEPNLPQTEAIKIAVANLASRQ